MTAPADPPAIHVTHHAVERYQERVRNLPDDQVRQLICTSKAVQLAVSIGAPFVRLGTGQRLVLIEGRVVTVLPQDQYPTSLKRREPHG